jgi:hypothetical protein
MVKILIHCWPAPIPKSGPREAHLAKRSLDSLLSRTRQAFLWLEALLIVIPAVLIMIISRDGKMLRRFSLVLWVACASLIVYTFFDFFYFKHFSSQSHIKATVDPSQTVDPCGPPFTSLQRMVDCAKKDLRPGRIAFEPKREMNQGEMERVSLRLSSQASADLTTGFKHGPPTFQAIEVGPVMRAVLEPPSDEFAAHLLGDVARVVDPQRPYTEWTWEVTPLSSGDHTLVVLIFADLMLPNGKSEAYPVYEGSAKIHVHVRPTYVVSKFLRENWQWLLPSSSVLLVPFAWTWKRFRKPKKRDAGFRRETSGSFASKLEETGSRRSFSRSCSTGGTDPARPQYRV